MHSLAGSNCTLVLREQLEEVAAPCWDDSVVHWVEVDRNCLHGPAEGEEHHTALLEGAVVVAAEEGIHPVAAAAAAAGVVHTLVVVVVAHTLAAVEVTADAEEVRVLPQL